ncbi:hypothetical protein SNEBB_001307 [Seison nebaliae]|nr:hypothetical protein SNEBB_001307 [Seison nebaliae]
MDFSLRRQRELNKFNRAVRSFVDGLMSKDEHFFLKNVGSINLSSDHYDLIIPVLHGQRIIYHVDEGDVDIVCSLSSPIMAFYHTVGKRYKKELEMSLDMDKMLNICVIRFAIVLFDNKNLKDRLKRIGMILKNENMEITIFVHGMNHYRMNYHNIIIFSLNDFCEIFQENGKKFIDSFQIILFENDLPSYSTDSVIHESNIDHLKKMTACWSRELSNNLVIYFSAVDDKLFDKIPSILMKKCPISPTTSTPIKVENVKNMIIERPRFIERVMIYNHILGSISYKELTRCMKQIKNVKIEDVVTSQKSLTKIGNNSFQIIQRNYSQKYETFRSSLIDVPPIIILLEMYTLHLFNLMSCEKDVQRDIELYFFTIFQHFNIKEIKIDSTFNFQSLQSVYLEKIEKLEGKLVEGKHSHLSSAELEELKQQMLNIDRSEYHEKVQRLFKIITRLSDVKQVVVICKDRFVVEALYNYFISISTLRKHFLFTQSIEMDDVNFGSYTSTIYLLHKIDGKHLNKIDKLIIYDTSPSSKILKVMDKFEKSIIQFTAENEISIPPPLKSAPISSRVRMYFEDMNISSSTETPESMERRSSVDNSTIKSRTLFPKFDNKLLKKQILKNYEYNRKNHNSPQHWESHKRQDKTVVPTSRASNNKPFYKKTDRSNVNINKRFYNVFCVECKHFICKLIDVKIVNSYYYVNREKIIEKIKISKDIPKTNLLCSGCGKCIGKLVTFRQIQYYTLTCTSIYFLNESNKESEITYGQWSKCPWQFPIIKIDQS